MGQIALTSWAVAYYSSGFLREVGGRHGKQSPTARLEARGRAPPCGRGSCAKVEEGEKIQDFVW